MPTRKQVVLALIIVVGLWLGVSWILRLVAGSIHEGGALGDSFGAVNALFSGLALAGIIAALYLQGKELSAQRGEFRHQAFEGTFFQLLRLHNEILHSFCASFIRGGQQFSGAQAFAQALDEVEHRIEHARRDFLSDEELLATLNAACEDVCFTEFADFGHYFRNLYHIVKFVDESPIHLEGFTEDEAKRRYTGILRAQLSQPEQALLFYNGLRNRGRSKVKPLLEKYGLLHALRLTPTIREHSRLYASLAFEIPAARDQV